MNENKIFNEINNILKSKNADYAKNEDPFANFSFTELYGSTIDYGIFTRMGDKVSRVCKSLRGEELEHDSLRDDLIDCLGYSIILYSYLNDISFEEAIDVLQESKFKRKPFEYYSEKTGDTVLVYLLYTVTFIYHQIGEEIVQENFDIRWASKSLENIVISITLALLDLDGLTRDVVESYKICKIEETSDNCSCGGCSINFYKSTNE